MLIVREALRASVAIIGRGEAIDLPRGGLLPNASPDAFHHFAVGVPFENSVAAQKDEIKFVSQFEFNDLGLTDDNLTVAAVLGSLGLNVAEGPRDGETAWKHAPWTLHIQVFLVRGSCSLRESLRPIHLTSRLLNAGTLSIVFRLVVTAQNGCLCPTIHTHKTAAVAHIDDKRNVVQN